MPKITDTLPSDIQFELEELNIVLNDAVPPKRMDQNILIATWNLTAFGDLTKKWESSENDSPKRDFHSVVCIAEIISRFDVIALQEVSSNLRALRHMMKYLGSNWQFILTDVNRGDEGNNERMAFLFDTRRVGLSGLACELVLSQEQLQYGIAEDSLVDQFVRTPYAVSFISSNVTFILVTLHILYGKKKNDRKPEIEGIVKWMSEWANDMHVYNHNFIALGDFNIDKKGDKLWEAFISEGLYVPDDLLEESRSIFDKPKLYDQIAWFDGSNGTEALSLNYIQGTVFNFLEHVLVQRNLSKQQLKWHISDHFPLWAEFEF